MRKERLQTEDIMAMVVGLHYPFAFNRYLTARQKAVLHKIPEVNILLERSFGVLLYVEDLIEICGLAGISRKDSKLFRHYEFLSHQQQMRLKNDFILGFEKLGYSKENICPLFHYIAYTACETLKKEYVAASVKRYIKQAEQLMF